MAGSFSRGFRPNLTLHATQMGNTPGTRGDQQAVSGYKISAPNRGMGGNGTSKTNGGNRSFSPHSNSSPNVSRCQTNVIKTCAKTETKTAAGNHHNAKKQRLEFVRKLLFPPDGNDVRDIGLPNDTGMKRHLR